MNKMKVFLYKIKIGKDRGKRIIGDNNIVETNQGKMMNRPKQNRI